MVLSISEIEELIASGVIHDDDYDDPASLDEFDASCGSDELTEHADGFPLLP
jgi:hypothetical protein